MGFLCCNRSKLSAGVVVAMMVPFIAQAASQGKNHNGLFATTALAEPESKQEKKPVSKYVLDYTMDSIDGKPIKLESFKGKVVLMVNTASKCGLTPQYESLEALYKAHEKDGLVIIGFPANNFMGQEPGTNEQIAEFCSTKYDITFPMMAKISVKGKDAHPLYQQLAAQPEPVGGEPSWNFDKFLVNRQGEVVARFGPRTKPDDKELVKSVEQLLSSD